MSTELIQFCVSQEIEKVRDEMKKKKIFLGNNVSNLPSNDSRPQASHIQKLIPTEPVLTSKPDGDTNIPDPVNKCK